MNRIFETFACNIHFRRRPFTEKPVKRSRFGKINKLYNILKWFFLRKILSFSVFAHLDRANMISSYFDELQNILNTKMAVGYSAKANYIISHHPLSE